MQGLLSLYREVVDLGFCERTIPALLSELKIDCLDGTLSGVTTLSSLLQEQCFSVVPPLESGDLETVRVITFRRRDEFSSEAVLRDISSGENHMCEFKSTLTFDLKRHTANPELRPEEVSSDDVLHAALKTIAAFLNSDGGTLLVGVDDAGDIIGLNRDYLIGKTATRDKLELHLRDCIKSRFYGGSTTSAFVRIGFCGFEDKDVAKISVTARPQKLSFVKRTSGGGERYCLYRRDGNRTVEVAIQDVEEFLERRRSRIAASAPSP